MLITISTHRDPFDSSVWRWARDPLGNIVARLHTPTWSHDDLAPVVMLNVWGR